MGKVDIMNSIKNSFLEGNNSHAFLLDTNNVDNCLKDILDLIKFINCDNHCEEEEPCNICRTIDAGNNPDVRVIMPDGKDIKKDQIMSVIDNFSTKTFMNKYSIYVIVDADLMNVVASNKLLKFLEEPEENIVGFFITSKVSNIISTIRSRCELYNITYDEDSLLKVLNINESEYDSYFSKSLELVSKLNTDPKYLLMSESKNYSKLERVDILNIFKLIYKFYIIKYEYDYHNKYKNVENIDQILDAVVINDINLIVKRIKLLDNIINDFQLNVNKELFLNNFFIRWE